MLPATVSLFFELLAVASARLGVHAGLITMASYDKRSLTPGRQSLSEP
jgi:hypothetical protein